MVYWATFVLGLASSLHCLSMCGPLALLIPRKQNASALSNGGYLFIYHSARILSYLVIGLFAASLGKLTSLLPEFVQHQKTIAITLGLFLLLMSFVPTFRIGLERVGNKHLHKVLSALMLQYQQFKTNHYGLASFSLGILHGLLPCGIVYSAAMMALLTGDVVHGTLAMLTFGIATSFTLILFRSLGSGLLPYLQGKWVRFAMVSLSILLLIRSQKSIIDLTQINKPVPEIVATCHK